MNHLVFKTFLSPLARPLYEAAAQAAAADLAITATLVDRSSYREYMDGSADVAFICSLPYVSLETDGPGSYVPIVAPILAGARYEARPIYFSDVIVPAESPIQSFADLRGKRWAFNEQLSQSGYGAVRHHLVATGNTTGYFKALVQTNSHAGSVESVVNGETDAAAIDSHALQLMLDENPTLRDRIRTVEVLGPSTVQPVVASTRLSASTRRSITASLATLHRRPELQKTLCAARVERFVPIGDEAYQDIREMVSAAHEAGFSEIR